MNTFRIRGSIPSRTALDAVTEEKNLVRKPWDPSPKLAKYDEVIALLTKAAEKA